MRPAKESLGRAEVVVALVAVLSYPLTFVAAISAAGVGKWVGGGSAPYWAWLMALVPALADFAAGIWLRRAAMRVGAHGGGGYVRFAIVSGGLVAAAGCILVAGMAIS
jgi:hypothetical protein